MNWLKTLWNWLVRKTSTAPKLAVVEEEAVADEEPTPVEVEEEDCVRDLFYQICRQAKVGHHELVRNGIVEAFESWYDGDCDEQSILNSIPQFRDEHPGAIAAKLARL